jgi:myosin VIIa
VFDRGLCVRQLRYAGLMETAKIRQSGFPIRFSYSEFVHRYRLIVPDIPPAEKCDCKSATKKICMEVLKDQEYRLGHTKVFLKDSHDAILEELRHKVLINAVIRVQANARRFIHRQRFLKLREAAITIQKHFRARGYRKRYLVMRRGYSRLQAAIKSRELRRTFVNLRKFFTKVQSRAKGYLVRKLVKEKGPLIQAKLLAFKNEKENELTAGKALTNAEENYETKYKQLMRSIWIIKDDAVESNIQNNTMIDDRYVDDVFDFLKDTATPGGTVRGTGFGVVSKFIIFLF